MKSIFVILLSLFFLKISAQKVIKTSGNLILKGWYADPEAIIFKNHLS
jgi:hypothetical protein